VAQDRLQRQVIGGFSASTLGSDTLIKHQSAPNKKLIPDNIAGKFAKPVGSAASVS
jgi:hypothetical protein